MPPALSPPPAQPVLRAAASRVSPAKAGALKAPTVRSTCLTMTCLWVSTPCLTVLQTSASTPHLPASPASCPGRPQDPSCCRGCARGFPLAGARAPAGCPMTPPYYSGLGQRSLLRDFPDQPAEDPPLPLWLLPMVLSCFLPSLHYSLNAAHFSNCSLTVLECRLQEDGSVCPLTDQQSPEQHQGWRRCLVHGVSLSTFSE